MCPLWKPKPYESKRAWGPVSTRYTHRPWWVSGRDWPVRCECASGLGNAITPRGRNTCSVIEMHASVSRGDNRNILLAVDSQCHNNVDDHTGPNIGATRIVGRKGDDLGI